jgi:hypothetical protein
VRVRHYGPIRAISRRWRGDVLAGPFDQILQTKHALHAWQQGLRLADSGSPDGRQCGSKDCKADK